LSMWEEGPGIGSQFKAETLLTDLKYWNIESEIFLGVYV